MEKRCATSNDVSELHNFPSPFVIPFKINFNKPEAPKKQKNNLIGLKCIFVFTASQRENEFLSSCFVHAYFPWRKVGRESENVIEDEKSFMTFKTQEIYVIEGI